MAVTACAPRRRATLGRDTLTAGMLAATAHRVGGKRVAALIAPAVQSIEVSTGVEAARDELETDLRGWRRTQARLARTEARQSGLAARARSGDVLPSRPGLGPVVVATLLWLGDLTRFADPRQVLKMAGLDLTQQSSGHRQRATPSGNGVNPPPAVPCISRRGGDCERAGGGLGANGYVSGRITHGRRRRRWLRQPVSSYRRPGLVVLDRPSSCPHRGGGGLVRGRRQRLGRRRLDPTFGTPPGVAPHTSSAASWPWVETESNAALVGLRP
jgi:hypothetical protein